MNDNQQRTEQCPEHYAQHYADAITQLIMGLMAALVSFFAIWGNFNILNSLTVMFLCGTIFGATVMFTISVSIDIRRTGNLLKEYKKTLNFKG